MNEDSEPDSFFSDLHHAVRQQLDSPATPYVRKTYDRLCREGLEDEQAVEAIASALAEESDAMIRSGRAFDEKSYRTRLGTISAGDWSS